MGFINNTLQKIVTHIIIIIYHGPLNIKLRIFICIFHVFKTQQTIIKLVTYNLFVIC